MGSGSGGPRGWEAGSRAPSAARERPGPASGANEASSPSGGRGAAASSPSALVAVWTTRRWSLVVSIPISAPAAPPSSGPGTRVGQ